MPGKQDTAVLAQRHVWVVGLICLVAVALAAGVATGDPPVFWLVVPALTLAAPAIASAMPNRTIETLAAASAGSLVVQAVFTVAAFSELVNANLIVITALGLIALYQQGRILAWAFGTFSVALTIVAIADPSSMGLDLGDRAAFATNIATGILAAAVTAAVLSVLWRSQQRAKHIAAQQLRATEAYLEVAGTLMMVLDRDGCITVANRQTCATLGYREDQIIGREWFELAVADEYRDDARRLFRASFDHYAEFGAFIASPQDYENVVITSRRERREVRWWSTFVTDTKGNPTGLVCSGTDVTEQRAAAAALERNRVELDALRRLAQEVASLDDSRQAVVDAALKLTDATVAGIMEPDRTRSRLAITVATDPTLIGHAVDIGREASVAATAFLSATPQFIAEVQGAQGTNQRLAQEIGVVSAVHEPIVGADGVVGILTVAWDHVVPSLQERKAELVGLVAHEAAIALRRRESLAQLERAALIDPLTGVANRRAFDAELPLALRRAAEGEYPLALVMIDLNEFKAVNDLLGHEAGDHVLIDVSTAWAGALRAGDLLARLGGDEFAVLLPTCDELEMAHIIARLHRATPHAPGASIGGALWTGSETASDLIRRADRSQYADKARARDRPLEVRRHSASTRAPRPRSEDPREDVGD